MDENIKINNREMAVSPLKYERFIREKKHTNAAKEYFANIAKEYHLLPKRLRDYLNQFSVTKIVYNAAGIITYYEISFKDTDIVNTPTLVDFSIYFPIEIKCDMDFLSQRLILSLDKATHVKMNPNNFLHQKKDACSLSTLEIALAVIKYIYDNIKCYRYYHYYEGGTYMESFAEHNYSLINHFSFKMKSGRAIVSFKCRCDILWRVLKYLFTDKSVVAAFNKLNDDRIILYEGFFNVVLFPDVNSYKIELECDASIFFKPEYIAIYCASIGKKISFGY